MTFFGSSFNLQESIETDNKKAHEYENKLLEGNGFKANEDYTADELNDFVQKHGSKQVKFIWNLIKAVAQKLGVTTRFMLQGNSKIPVGAAGHYLNGKIENRASLFSHPESAARIIVHELVHGVTTYILKAVEQNNTKILSKLTTRQLKAVEKLNALFDELKKDKEFDDTYGTKNTHELLAELTNENFVDKLKSKNVFEKILEAIFEIFNIPFNAYNESVKILEDLISNPLEDNRYEGSLGEGYSLYSKSESTKLQQLKQKLAEVNKKIDDITKRFDSQIAQKQAELKALEQSLKETPQEGSGGVGGDAESIKQIAKENGIEVVENKEGFKFKSGSREFQINHRGSKEDTIRKGVEKMIRLQDSESKRNQDSGYYTPLPLAVYDFVSKSGEQVDSIQYANNKTSAYIKLKNGKKIRISNHEPNTKSSDIELRYDQKTKEDYENEVLKAVEQSLPTQEVKDNAKPTIDNHEAAKKKTQGNRIEKSPLTGGKRKEIRHIIRDFKNAAKTRIFYTKVGRRAAGTYNSSEGAIRLRYAGDLDTTAHEAGHDIDDRYKVIEAILQNPAARAELVPFVASPAASKPPKGHPNPQNYLQREGFAEWLRAFIVNTRYTRRRYTTI